MLGVIEGGGTKFIAAVSDHNLNIVDRISVPTSEPVVTLDAVEKFFRPYNIHSLGVGCFGPIDLNRSSSTYGYIKSTPKLAWKNFNVLGALKDKFNIPISIETDVNVAAYGEFKKGAALGLDSCIYITIGTGIGGGVIINGRIIDTNNNPELGHIFVKRFLNDDFPGVCPYHNDCLEGVASGPALAKRAQTDPQNLPENHKLWELEAYYIAQAIVTYTLVLSPAKIILGGGVMQQRHLLSMIKESFIKQMNGYVDIVSPDNYIVLPKLQNDAAVIGGLIMAKEAIGREFAKDV